jgi:hypothetical protein
MPFDFEANKVVEDINKVPEDFRSFYKEASDGSGHALDESSPAVKSAVKVISGLWSTVANQRREVEGKIKTGVETALSPLSEYGSDANAILEAITTRIDEAKKGGKGAKDAEAALDKLRKDLTDVHSAEKNKWTEKEKTLVDQIRKLLVDNVIGEALGDRAVSQTVARRVIADFVDIDADEAGDFRTIVKDEHGDTRKRVTDGQFFTVDDLIKELQGKDDYKPLFKSEAPRGSGSPPGGPSRRVEVPVPGANKSAVDKIRDGLRTRDRR